DGQVVPGGEVGGRDDGADASRVDGHRLFHEDVLAGFERGPEVEGTERRWRGQQGEVHAAVDHLLVGVPADEAAVLGDLVLVAQAGEIPAAIVEAVAEEIAQSDDLDTGRGVHAVARGAGAAAAAADQADANRVCAGGVGVEGLQPAGCEHRRGNRG